MTDTITQVHRVYVDATPERIWEAITSPEWSQKYGFRSVAEYDLRPGGSYRGLWPEAAREQYGLPEVAVDGEVLEVDPPRKLVQTWRLVMDETTAAEGFTRVTFEIEPGGPNIEATRLTVTHELTGAPQTAALVAGHLEETGAGGGWAFILSDLKSVLETGKSIGAG